MSLLLSPSRKTSATGSSSTSTTSSSSYSLKKSPTAASSSLSSSSYSFGSPLRASSATVASSTPSSSFGSRSALKGVKKLSLDSPSSSRDKSVSSSSGVGGSSFGLSSPLRPRSHITSPTTYSSSYASPTTKLSLSKPASASSRIKLSGLPSSSSLSHSSAASSSHSSYSSSSSSSSHYSMMTMPNPSVSHLKLKTPGSPSALAVTQPHPHVTPPSSHHLSVHPSPYAEPHSPIASASPNARRLKLQSMATADKPPAARKILDHGNTHGEVKKTGTLFSPAYLRKEEEDRKSRAGSANSSRSNSPSSSRGSSAGGRRSGVHGKSVAPVQYTGAHSYTGGVSVQAYAAGQMDDSDDFDPFLFIKNLPPLSPRMKNRISPLPKKAPGMPKITLALDLDETLVHCSIQPLDKAELTFHVNFNGVDYEVYVRTRPHMREFLHQVSQWFEVIIFTASQKVYADSLLNIIDPERKLIHHRVFRDSCVCVDGNYLKDLHILGRDMHAVCLVDNSVQAFSYQLNNGIPIESWFDDDHDRELLHLLPFLHQMKDLSDVRPFIRDTFKLEELVRRL